MTTSPVAVVTGAARGIGAATAEALSARGFNVVRADIASGEQVHAVDVRRPDSLRELAAHAASLGDVQVWVNNAGVMVPTAAWEGTDADVDRQVEVNLLGVIHGSRAALGVMRAGDVVNIASMSAYGPMPGIAVYAATKAAVRSWSLSLAAELREAGRAVRVHALCPDPVDTRLVHDVADEPGMELIHTAPRLLATERIAQAVVAMLGSRRQVRSIPRWRAALAQTSSMAPAVTAPALDLMRQYGARRQSRRRREPGQSAHEPRAKGE